MRKALLGIAAAALPFIAAPALAQGAACDRGDLQNVADKYVAAQTTGVPLTIPFADFTQYTEQGDLGSMSSGILSTPLKIDFHRSLLDVTTCTTFTELVSADPAQAYVVGAKLQFAGRFSPIAADRVNDIEFVVTDKDDRQFDAGKTLQHVRTEKWGEIAAGDRDTRAALLAAADAYLDALGGKSVQVPYAASCARLDGGAYTDNCAAGLPAGAKLGPRRYVVDDAIGAVAVLVAAGDEKLPNVHLFRIEKGRIRYVHVMTVCNGGKCGLPSA